jgi:hypothetical protein
MILGSLLGVAIILFFFFGKAPSTIKGHWQHFYDNIQISINDFYAQVKAGLIERKIDGLKYEQESFLESHIFSAKRVYLRINEHEYVFYICAAPFGTGTFISWWLCVKDEQLINRIPILNKLAGKDRQNKSFYQMDTEDMYKAVIHSTVVAVADSLTADKGLRLTEMERQYLQTTQGK